MICCFLLIAFSVITYYVLRFLWELLTIGDFQSKAVFITGCDTGFGRTLAVKCARNGFHVFAGCLTENGAKECDEEAGKLKETMKGSLQSVIVDITKDESVNQAVQFVKNHLKPGIKLWAIVNNAGVFTTYGPDDWCSIDVYKFSFEVNTTGHIRVTKAFKPLLKQSKGRIVTATSVAGRIALPYAAPYSTAKFACEAYMDCVRQEVKPWGVTVSIVEPGVFKTPIVDRSGMKNRIDSVWSKLTDEQKEEYGEEFKNSFAIHWSDTFYNLGSPHVEWVIDDYYHAVTAMFPRNRYRVGWDAYFVFIPSTFLPTMLVDAINAYLLAPKMKPAALEKAKQS